MFRISSIKNLLILKGKRIIMKIVIDPIIDLKHTRDQLALEFFSLAPATDFLKKVMPGLVNSFSGTVDAVKLPDIAPLKKDQTKFLKVLKDVPFSEIGELRAYSPEGMSKLYLEYFEVLLPVTTYLKTIQSEVIQPYTLFLAQLVSDKLATISTNNKKQEYIKLEEQREQIYKDFSKMYEKDSYKAETIVKCVVERNQDWLAVFSKLNECTNNIQSIDKELLKRQIQQCVDYLAIIQDNLEKDTMVNTSKEVAARLSNGAYQIAKTAELYSTTYYRVLALNGSIENTIEHILKVVG